MSFMTQIGPARCLRGGARLAYAQGIGARLARHPGESAPLHATREIGWPAMGFALLGALSVAFVSGSAWMALPTALIWFGSLWLARPEPEPARPAVEEGSLSRRAMIDLIEPFGVPVLMLDKNRIAAANAAAREALGQHLVGQDARVALRHPEAIALLDVPSGRVEVKGLTGPRSIWQVSRNPIDDRFSLLELVNRTAEADTSRAHTDFVANASHELRTPLASIIGYVETLADPDAKVDKATTRKFHATVLREARRLQSLVEDLMALSRIEAEKHDPPRDRIDLARLATSIAHETGDTLDTDRVVAAGEPAGLFITGDQRQLDQLIRNLIDNALKYGHPERPVTVAVTAEGHDAVLSVRDEGEGIPADHLPYLTRRFYRTDPGRSRAAGGTGLGLAIVKHIVERHRGRFDIASTVGVGTTVTARFRMVEANPADVAASQPSAPMWDERR